jgi:hypothetical protein
MGLLHGIMLIVLGCLAIPSLIIAKRPDAKQVLDKITPYQGWIGLIGLAWGVYALLFWILPSLGWLGGGMRLMLWFIVAAVDVALLIILGFMMGIGTLKTFIKNPNAQAKMDQTLVKLAPKQGTLGVVAIIVGLFVLLNSIVHIL